MPKHRNDAYQDDAFKWVVFCKVCGQEGEDYKPDGECSGHFEPRPLRTTQTTNVVGKSQTLREFSESQLSLNKNEPKALDKKTERD